MTDVRYNTSKLMELLATRELAEQLTQSLKPGNILASIVNPGSVRTNINRNQPLIFRAVMFVVLLIVGRPVEVGARTVVHPCLAGQESHGQYLDNCQVGV